MDILIISLLILLGIILLVIEVAMIPGVGITGIVGSLSLVASILYAFYYINALAGWITLFIVLFAFITIFLWFIYGKPIDNVALKKNIESVVENPEATALKVGDTGVARTRLALVGEAEFGDNRVEVNSSCGFIDEGESIVIERIAGATIFVKKNDIK